MYLSVQGGEDAGGLDGRPGQRGRRPHGRSQVYNRIHQLNRGSDLQNQETTKSSLSFGSFSLIRRFI